VQVLTASHAIAEYFEKAAAVSNDPRATANWVTGDLMGLLNAAGKQITESPVSAENLGELLALIARGEISGKLAKEILPKMFATGEPAAGIVEREGLRQISDAGALAEIVDQVLASSPKQVDQYKSGKTAVLGYLVGQVMKATRGQANPGAVNQLLKQKLS
jgi:aspartyl-tRNA(Asn)/glutamyl-tRNA(Gln) amidotransferase subunit B